MVNSMKSTLLFILFFGFIVLLSSNSITGVMATDQGNGKIFRSSIERANQNPVKKLDLGGGVSLEVLYPTWSF